MWVLSVLSLAAGIAPWLYIAGKGLAESAATGDLSAPLEWLGAACGRAEFSRFFSRSLSASAVVLLPFLCWRIRTIRARNRVTAEPVKRIGWMAALGQIVVGCVIAGGMLWAMGMMLESLGAYAPRAHAPGVGKALGRIIASVVMVPLFEEWLFRGILLGLWLKFARPFAACIGTSLFFAFVHFLKLPEGMTIADPASPLAGFELVGKVLFHFMNPQFFVTDFATLFFIGMMLAWARVRTGKLWFSIGLHAGWVLSFKAFNQFHETVSSHPLHPWGVGDSLRSGLFPLLTLVATAGICQFVLRRFEPGCGAPNRASR